MTLNVVHLPNKVWSSFIHSLHISFYVGAKYAQTNTFTLSRDIILPGYIVEFTSSRYANRNICSQSSVINLGSLKKILRQQKQPYTSMNKMLCGNPGFSAFPRTGGAAIGPNVKGNETGNLPTSVCCCEVR